jgi:CBS domain-containing protein
MSLERVCNREVISVRPETTLLEVAQLMHTRHVGSVVVVEEYRPIGILTDRDIVVKVVAAERDPKTVQASEVMVSNPALININYDPLDVTRIMRDRGLRRLPVVDENRHLLGIVTLDDVLGLLGTEVANLAEAVHTELTKEGTAATPL